MAKKPTKTVEFSKQVFGMDRVKIVRALKKGGLSPTILPVGGSKDSSSIVVKTPLKGLARWVRRHKSLLTKLNFPRFMPKEDGGPLPKENEPCNS